MKPVVSEFHSHSCFRQACPCSQPWDSLSLSLRATSSPCSSWRNHLPLEVQRGQEIRPSTLSGSAPLYKIQPWPSVCPSDSELIHYARSLTSLTLPHNPRALLHSLPDSRLRLSPDYFLGSYPTFILIIYTFFKPDSYNPRCAVHSRQTNNYIYINRNSRIYYHHIFVCSATHAFTLFEEEEEK